MVSIGGNRPETKLRKTKMCKFFSNEGCSRGDKCTFAHNASDLQSAPDLHKTQLCMAFARNGTCRDGQACKYAHGESELRAISAKHSYPSFNSDSQFTKVSFAMPVVMLSAVVVGKATPQVPAIALKSYKEFDTCSVLTTDEGLEMDLESLGSTSRQTSDSTSISEDASSDQVVYDSESVSECRSACDDSSEAGAGQKVAEESLRKTKMCKYFLQGSCKRGLECHFAHDLGNIKARPNLFRTNLCMAFERSGRCKHGDNCKYAHGRDQLQVMPLVEEASKGTLDAAVKEYKADHSYRLTHEESGVVVSVRNTFLHLCFPKYERKQRSFSWHK